MKTAAPLDLQHVALHGVTLIEASAGTGKTYTLAALYMRLLLESELRVDQILVVTYTRAATAELRVRIRKRIVQAIEALDSGASDDAELRKLVEEARHKGQTTRRRVRLSDALRSFDEAAIFTIHGFCQRVLKRHAFESGAPFEVELGEDQRLLLEEIVCDFWAARLARASETLVRALARHRLDIASSVRFLQRTLPNPQLAIEPAGGEPDTEQLEQVYRDARARAASLWAAERDAIIRALLQPGLHKAIFSEKKLRETYLPLCECLATCDVFDLPNAFSDLTPERLADRTNKGYTTPRHAFFEDCADLHQAADTLREAFDQQVYQFSHELLAYARCELARRAEAQGRMGFEDLLLRVYDALRGEHGPALIEVVREQYRAALIDEFQDTDPVQLEVFRRIYAGASEQLPLFLIGDPKQAIYAFRGADIFAYLSAARRTVDRVYSLAINRRSDPSLVRAVQAIFARAAQPFVFSDIAYHHVSAAPQAVDQLAGPALELLFVPRGKEPSAQLGKLEIESIPARIAAEITQLLGASSAAELDGRPIEPRHIAVLCRTNAQALAVQAALREVRVPAVLDGDASVFDSPMAEELGRWLWAMVEPADSARVRAALATRGLAVSADTLLELDRDQHAWDEYVARFQELQQLWQTRGFMRALHALCDAFDVAENLLALPDGERRYTDLWHLAELLHEQALSTRKGPRALLDFYRQVRANEAEQSGMALEDVQLRLESDAHAVTLTTIHKSKGLEFPIVFCPYLWALGGRHPTDKRSPLFHDRSAGDRPTLLLPTRGAVPDNADRAAEREALAEHARLAYVALTRAKHRLYLVWGAFKGFHESALAYLLHQPPGRVADSLHELTAARAKNASDTELLADLSELALAAEGAVHVRPLLAADAALPYLRAPLAPRALEARVGQRAGREPQRIGSFSSLAASDPSEHSEPEALDHDALASAAASVPELAPETLERVAWDEFPAGASFGHLVHAIYEHADFSAGQLELEPVVQNALADFGRDLSWSAPLCAAVFDTLHTSLRVDGGELPSLASVSPQARLCELEFVFPVAHAHSEHAGIAPERLAQVLHAHACSDHERAYVERLRKLRFAPLRGFLRGFIDLVVEHEGRYYVLDYKSNRLGPTAADHRRDKLEPVMRRHHYPLQYLLYTLAVHRYLALRLRGYDYDRHFGGVYYLFVRGMSPKHELGSGVFYDRPRRELIGALGELLDGAA